MKKTKKRKHPKVTTVEDGNIRTMPPKMFRRKERSLRNRSFKRRNDGQQVNSNAFFQMLAFTGSPIFTNSKRSKFKGWQRENRRYKKAS